MKRTLFLVLCLVVGSIVAVIAQKPRKIAPSYAWRIIEPLGLRETATLDTLPINYAQESVPSFSSDAYATTGNLGAEGKDMIFARSKGMSDFFFTDALSTWLPSEQSRKFYNTRIPMTLLSFNSAGGRDNAQERLKAIFSGNINAKAQVGALLDYLYSKGSYNYQATKDLIWGVSGSYLGDRYEFQGYFNHWNMVNKENGGITDVLYITDPAELQGGVTTINPKSIPTRLTAAHTRVAGTDLMLNNRYKIGYWHEEEIEDADTMRTVRTYIPVTSAIWTLRYKQGRHVFDNGNATEGNEFFEHRYLSPDHTHDYTTMWSLENTVGISLLEGFHRLAKFGLAAFVTHQIRRYEQTPDTLNHVELGLDPFPEGIDNIDPRATQNLAWVGGQLTKQRGSLLTYGVTGRFGLLGPVAGDIDVEGDVRTRFKLFGDSVSVVGRGSFHNEAPPYLMNNYLSNHFIWRNDFSKTRRVGFGGTLTVGRTGTVVDVDVDNIQNQIYFDSSALPRQSSSNIQVLSLRLSQNLKYRALHWDNRVTYQTTSDDVVLPLPNLAIYSNLYFTFRIATLYMQLGVDCNYYTKYYAPAYQPATASFVNQRDVKLGNYPFMNAYANMKLSKTRFYVLFSHVNQGLFGGNNYFSSPNYPLNPRRFQIGLSIDFAD